jgi:hypothetical protein
VVATRQGDDPCGREWHAHAPARIGAERDQVRVPFGSANKRVLLSRCTVVLITGAITSQTIAGDDFNA